MKLIRYKSPITAFHPGHLLDELDRLFEAGFPGPTQNSAARFPVDVYQDSDSVRIRAELPGFRKENLRVNVADDILTIAGHVAAGESQDKGSARTETSLERTIALPENLNYDKVAAAYENGVLTVTLPKREETKPKTIAVEVK